MIEKQTDKKKTTKLVIEQEKKIEELISEDNLCVFKVLIRPIMLNQSDKNRIIALACELKRIRFIT